MTASDADDSPAPTPAGPAEECDDPECPCHPGGLYDDDLPDAARADAGGYRPGVVL